MGELYPRGQFARGSMQGYPLLSFFRESYQIIQHSNKSHDLFKCQQGQCIVVTPGADCPCPSYRQLDMLLGGLTHIDSHSPTDT